MTTEQRGPLGSDSNDVLGAVADAKALRLQEITRKTRARWFVKHGHRTYFSRGFRSKADASAWIDSHGDDLDWRVGYHFRLKGERTTTYIVDRNGEPASAERLS